MSKRTPTKVEVDDEGVKVEIELFPAFLDFYKKETGHSHITKKGLTRFLNNMIRLHEERITECLSQ